MPAWLTGLRWRLVLLISFALLPAIAHMVVHGIEQRDHGDEEARAQTLNLARLAAHEQARRIEGARQLLIALANGFRVDDPAACVRHVRALVDEYRGLYSEIGWADASGRVMCHALDGENLSIADRQYFREAMETGGFVVGELLIGKISRVPILAFAYPMRDEQGATRGVLFANVDLRVLSQSLEQPARESGGVISILDRNGALVASSSRGVEFIGTTTNAELLRDVRSEQELVRSFAGPDGQTRQYAVATVKDLDGVPRLFVTFGRSEQPLRVAIAQRFREELESIGLLALGMFAAGWIGAEWLVRRPVQHLLEATAALGAGQLATRAKTLTSTKEFGELASGFNRMAEQLEQRDVHLRAGQRLEAIGQLAGGIAHDFNNLLTVILGYGASLEERLPDSLVGARRDVAELRRAAEKGASLTRQLLAFSRRQLLQPKLMDLNEIVQQMQSMLRRVIGSEIQLDVRLGEQIGLVRADPAQIEQVVLNLVINARDAMPNGGLLQISTRRVTKSATDADSLPAGDYVQLEVADSGVGMDAATRARIFEPFFTTKGPRGTGLGLATVYGIVKQSGGDIQCESAVNRGARFEILLPRVAGELTATEAPKPAAITRGTERVLVIEDDAAVRSFIASTLSPHGYDVCTAEDGLDGLDVMRRTSDIALVVSDVRMPRMNGLAFYAQLRRTHPDLPTILISGDSAPDITPADGSEPPLFLQKPFTTTALLSLARDAMSRAPIGATSN